MSALRDNLTDDQKVVWDSAEAGLEKLAVMDPPAPPAYLSRLQNGFMIVQQALLDLVTEEWRNDINTPPTASEVGGDV